MMIKSELQLTMIRHTFLHYEEVTAEGCELSIARTHTTELYLSGHSIC